MNWKDVPIPARMAYLDKDRRGFPIPFIVAREKDGKPCFTVNDDRKVSHAMAYSLCAICGCKLEEGDMWFVGGPLSAFHPHGAFVDGPMHRECSTYALMVCPYLAAPVYSRRIDDRGVNLENTDFAVAVDPTVMPNRPEAFVQAQAVSFSMSWPREVGRNYVHPTSGFHVHPETGEVHPRKWLHFEVWRQGEIIEDENEGIEIIRTALEEAGAKQRIVPKIIVPPEKKLIV